MQIFYSEAHKQHNPVVEVDHGRLVPYADTPGRIEAIRDRLLHDHLAECIEPALINDLTFLQSTHSPAMIEFLSQRARHMQPGQDYVYPEIFPITEEMKPLANQPHRADGYFAFDVYSPIGRGTWMAAFASASLAVNAASALLNGQAAAYALCRPPGHHAGRNFYGGYCYLNNAALAAQVLKKAGRTAILDLDYHHGNGTQSIFWNDADTLVVSLHADPAFEYPHYCGFSNETGGPDAPGSNHNFPLPAGTDGKPYLHTLATALDMIHRFAPASLIVSMGFDTSAGDLTTTFQLTPTDYRRIGQALAALQQPTLFVQEGGYGETEIGRLAAALMEGFEK